jgi:glycyl-tRNA synthetase beta chain
MPDFLLEIGCEEIPAGYIAAALDAFKASLAKSLEAEGLSFGEIRCASTPRRLVWLVPSLPVEQPGREIEIAGPPARIAFDAQGKPTRAAEGFARAQGVAPGALIRKSTGKGDYLFAVKSVPPRATADLLASVLPGLIAAIPFPKSMYWRDPAFRFARPLRRILALFGDAVVPFEVNGVKSARATVGHPFLAPAPIDIPRADLGLLTSTLKKAFVLVDRAERRALILSQVEKALAAHGSKLREFDLLEEVADLVEWPEILEGSFSEDYLVLPEEVVTAAMMEHQRYFPVRDSAGRLVSRFLAISNRRREDTPAIREGNERVLAARLNDARFFWDSDLKKPLEKVAAALSNVMYLAGLGTVADKVSRMKDLAAFAAGASGLSAHKAAAVEAASLSKADLLTEMVFEFPSLQGVMGRAYALAQGKARDVAAAIEEHYLPRTLSGDLPATPAGRLVALADKADTLAGAFFTGLIPSGSQDPYGLRRASIGIVRIIVEGQLRLGLAALLEKAWDLVSKSAKGPAKSSLDELMSFIRERIYQYYLDRGARHDVLRACLAAGFDDMLDFANRRAALDELSAEPIWPELVTAVERTFNITKSYSGPDAIDPALLAEKEERILYDLLSANASRLTPPPHASAADYAAASRAYLGVFGVPLHTFFDKVFVNVDDLAVRNNRLALIRAINRLYSSRIADLAQIVQEGKSET